MSDCDSVENKRKRQDSIQGAKVLLADAAEPATEAARGENDVEEEEEDEEEEDTEPVAVATEGGSSPVKRPRTSEDGGGTSPAPNNAKEAKEAAESVQDKVKGISMEDEAPKKPALPVFGSAFGSGGGFSSFASAAKKASPFAAYTTATSGFAKYATANTSASSANDTVAATASSASVDASVEAAESDSDDVAGNEDLDSDDDNSSSKKTGGKAQRRTFEDLLTSKGKESLQLHGAGSPVSTPLTASGFTHPAAVALASPLTPVRTFEEDETCLLSTKAKLFELQNAAWKERGGGQFKINCKTEQPDKCRMLMRTDLTFRLILNVPLFHGLKAVCERRFVRFTCFDQESKLPITYALRFATDALASSTYVCISNNIPEGHDSDSGSEEEDEDEEEEDEEEDEEEEDEEEAEDEVEVENTEEEEAGDDEEEGEADASADENQEQQDNLDAVQSSDAQSDAESQQDEQHSSGEEVDEAEEEEAASDDDEDSEEEKSEDGSDQEQSESNDSD
ncbi:hypothetical protein IWW38_000715 [Coemansia aciculifera]|uniref:Uncharacterized protein n=1 Tax=Coemansia aciculifera TaxID=417176 RepID=A0ACC1M9Y8_9FUNG|nr:hypothetical protein IWW38_000715 [Coemansia aciculifera]